MNTPIFSSFEALLPTLPTLQGTVPNLADYLGHLPPLGAAPDAEKEPLTEHIRRVNDNALGLLSAHGLEPVVERLATEVCQQTGIRAEPFSNWLKELFLGAIAFHDFGKLNENFQRERMQQPQFAAVANGIRHHHAGLGAYLFAHHFFQRALALSPLRSETTAVAALLLDFADLIALHHSPRLHETHWHEDTAQLRRYLVLPGLGQGPDPSGLLQPKERQKFREQVLATRAGSDGFPRFALLKLCFSLLTASDYLATLGYMQTGGDYTRLDAATLGILEDKDKKAMQASFNSFPYNYEALAATDHWADWPWEQLQERSEDNLRLLRKKLLASVVREVQQRPAEPLYYLEAPTGSGKTNLSLAVALELLARDARLGKVFYVFPFTTLITQTYGDIKDKLKLGPQQLVQLHSKAEFASKAEAGEGSYGPQWHNHVDNLFVQYPVTLLSHVRFFEILKSNRKEANYLLHRLANSVVVLDEMQSYSPALWDHVNYFLRHYARLFNIRVVVMSATLPPLHKLTRETKPEKPVLLVPEAKCYFQNANFAGRVKFDFELLGRDWRGRYKAEAPTVLVELADAVAERCAEFAAGHGGKVAAIIEFITKKSASEFAKAVSEHPELSGYAVRVLSGTILEPRRREVVAWLKAKATRNEHPHILLICTQVVEAGVDIDMDLGFKDRSLLDSDEQLAGRVNRNASRPQAPVYLFDLDSEQGIYQGDLRLKVARELTDAEYRRMLVEKDFASFYQRGIEKLNSKEGTVKDTFGDYLQLVQLLDYPAIDYKFRLIDNETQSVFIPWKLPAGVFSDEEKVLLQQQGYYQEEDPKVDGKQVFELYVETVKNRTGDFIRDREARQRLQSVLSKFTISVYPQLAEKLKGITPKPDWHDYGFVYLHEPQHVYSYEEGLLAKGDYVAANIF